MYRYHLTVWLQPNFSDPAQTTTWNELLSRVRVLLAETDEADDLMPALLGLSDDEQPSATSVQLVIKPLRAEQTSPPMLLQQHAAPKRMVSSIFPRKAYAKARQHASPLRDAEADAGRHLSNDGVSAAKKHIDRTVIDDDDEIIIVSQTSPASFTPKRPPPPPIGKVDDNDDDDIIVVSNADYVPTPALARTRFRRDTCIICMDDEFSPTDVIKCSQGHTICRECFTQHIRHQCNCDEGLDDIVRRNGQIACPETPQGCRSVPFDNYDMAKFVDKAAFNLILKSAATMSEHLGRIEVRLSSIFLISSHKFRLTGRKGAG